MENNKNSLISMNENANTISDNIETIPSSDQNKQNPIIIPDLENKANSILQNENSVSCGNEKNETRNIKMLLQIIKEGPQNPISKMIWKHTWASIRVNLKKILRIPEIEKDLAICKKLIFQKGNKLNGNTIEKT